MAGRWVAGWARNKNLPLKGLPKSGLAFPDIEMARAFIRVQMNGMQQHDVATHKDHSDCADCRAFVLEAIEDLYDDALTSLAEVTEQAFDYRGVWLKHVNEFTYWIKREER